MIIGIVAPVGFGKTCLLTWFAKLFYSQGYTIHSNYKIDFAHNVMGGEELILRMGSFPIMGTNEGDYDNLPHKYFLDELGELVRATEFLSSGNEVQTRIATKSRKKGTDIIFSTQSLGMIDRQIRRIMESLLFVSYDKKSKKVSVIPQVREIVGSRFYEGWSIDASLIFPHYDTNEIIESNPDAILQFFVEQVKNDAKMIERLSFASKPSVKDSILKEHYKLRSSFARILRLELELYSVI